MSESATLHTAATVPDCGTAPCGLDAGIIIHDAGMEFLHCGRCGVLRIPPAQLVHQSVDADPLAPLSLVMRILMTMRMLWLKAVVPAFRNPETTIVDVGCGDGQFFEFLKRSGYHNAIGIEPEADRRAHAKARGLEVYASWNDADSARKRPVRADILIVWHVLEHIPQPAGFLQELAERVTPGGVVLVSVPNQRGMQTRLFGYYSSYPDYGRHIWYHDAAYAAYLSRMAAGAAVRLLPDFNFEYEIFSWVDSIISALVRQQNCVHIALKKGRGHPAMRAVIALAAVALLPLAGVLAVVSLLCGRGSTLTFELTPRQQAGQ